MAAERAVTYARVSGDDRGKDGRNLAGQTAMCKEYATSHQYSIVAELAEDDRGASGANIDLPQLEKVRELARDHAFDVLVVREIDRLSRNLAKQLIVEQELKKLGVRIEYVLGEYPDTPEGNLLKHVKASIAEYEREQIKIRVNRGKRLKVKAGSVMTNGTSRPPYGYKAIMDGNIYRLEIYEPEARIVRDIYSWYAYGDEHGQPVSMRGIVRRLKANNVPTRMDTNSGQSGYKKRGYAEWSKGQLGNILTSEVYRGIWVYGKRGARDNDGNLINDLIEVSVPAIVTDETWQLANDRREHNRERSAIYKGSPYMLSGRMRCGLCGSSFNGEAINAHKYYRCLAIHKGATDHKCHIPSFRVDQVDEVVWDWLSEQLTNQDKLQSAIDARLDRDNAVLNPHRERLHICNDLLEDNHQQLGRLLDLYITGDLPRDLLTDRKTRLESSIKALKAERGRLYGACARATLDACQIDKIKKFANEIGRNVEAAQDNPTRRREVIETVDLHVTLTVEDGQKIVYASCNLDEEPKRFSMEAITLR